MDYNLLEINCVCVRMFSFFFFKSNRHFLRCYCIHAHLIDVIRQRSTMACLCIHVSQSIIFTIWLRRMHNSQQFYIVYRFRNAGCAGIDSIIVTVIVAFQNNRRFRLKTNSQVCFYFCATFKYTNLRKMACALLLYSFCINITLNAFQNTSH